MIFVDDGGQDDSLALLRAVTARDPRVTVLELSRNSGQHAAIVAGFAASRGAVVVTLDADLQNPPEEIARLVAAIEAGHDVVGTWREAPGPLVAAHAVGAHQPRHGRHRRRADARLRLHAARLPARDRRADRRVRRALAVHPPSPTPSRGAPSSSRSATPNARPGIRSTSRSPSCASASTC
ncbi:MAG: glycosyltransferase [Candidatus Binatia bacterium]